MDQKTGMAAILAIVAALGSYVLTCTGNPIWALLAALIAVPLGVIGLVMAASPRVSGGILSIAAIILAVLGLIFAILGFFVTLPFAIAG